MDVREKLVELPIDDAILVLREEHRQRTDGYTTYLAHGGKGDPAEEVGLDALAMAISALEKTKWVSVNDRLPEQPPNRVDEQGRSWFTPDIDCIVCDGENVFAAHYCFQNKCFWYADTLHPLKNITHWMPMPQPPKGGGNEV